MKPLQEKKTTFSLKKAATEVGIHEAKPVQAEEAGYTRFNFICDKSIVKKIRDISRMEGVSIRQIMEKALTEWLSKYEGKNGPVGQMRNRSIEEL